jgi:SAM-dependent methyltransferase
MPGVCRFCATQLQHSFIDLGMSPLSNAYLKPEQLNCMEPFYPLHAWVCEQCKLVQLEEFESPESIFSDYAYFSSYSPSWLAHAKAYTEMMIERFAYNDTHQVIEIASNDGYLLQYFKQQGIPVLGIEPAANVAAVARAQGIETLVKFFGVETASTLPRKGDLILGNNVLAHVPDLNDFVGGLKLALAENGLITMEFPHLLRLIEERQFDTIYHEHFSYLSLYTVKQIFARHGLRIFDVEQLSTHGGSLRIYACHQAAQQYADSPSLTALVEQERTAGLESLQAYTGFSAVVEATKRSLLSFLITAKEQGSTVVGYGAPAKGNTLLNYCGIRTDFIDYTVDRSPHKQGSYLPGTHIPVYAPGKIEETRPDIILILPWNLKNEIARQLEYTREWGCQLIVPVPTATII